jgi:hypothetical protein
MSMGRGSPSMYRVHFLLLFAVREDLQHFDSKKDSVLSGRKSFPSGHSSTAFAGMTFLALWIAGQTAAWCFHAPKPAASLRSSRMGLLFMTLLPLLWAFFVAISRVEDYASITCWSHTCRLIIHDRDIIKKTSSWVALSGFFHQPSVIWSSGLIPFPREISRTSIVDDQE